MNSRIDVIGTNGNDGEHYDELLHMAPESTPSTYPYKAGDSYATKVENVVNNKQDYRDKHNIVEVDSVDNILTKIDYLLNKANEELKILKELLEKL